VIRAVVRPVAALLYLDGSYDRIEPAKWIAQLQTLRATCASLPIIGYAPLTGPAFEQGMLASRAGVSEIALHGRDLLCDSVARLVDAAATHGAGRELLTHVLAVAPALSGDTLGIVQYCIDRATEALTVGRLSIGVGLSRRTLAYRLSRTALPAPEQLIMWCRLLVVAWLLQEPRCTVNHAARTLNCRGPSSLRSLTMSYLGCPPRDLKDSGAIARVAAAMVASGAKSS
jgi:AraC-like DNA-binding protein